MDQHQGRTGGGGFTARTEREAAIVAQLAARYDFLEALGKGGFASVYKVRNRHLDRVEALKVLSDELTQDADFIKRFSVEAKICASFTHPNIVTIYEFQRVDRFFYFTMQHVGGPALSRFIKPENRLAEDRVVEIIAIVADALQYAHDKGVIHRDIKPDNILLDDAGIPFVMDFGIAKSDRSLTKTRTGIFLGSPYYASPEQAEGIRVDARTDVYSLGVTLYALLSSRHPFEGESAVSIMAKKLTETPVPLRSHNPHVHPGLVEVINRALERDPGRRFQTAAALATALRSAAAGDAPTIRTEPAAAPILDTPPGRARGGRRRRALYLALTTVGVAVAIAVGGVMIGRRPPPADRARSGPAGVIGQTTPVTLPETAASSEPSPVAAGVEARPVARSPNEDLLDVAEQLMSSTAGRDDLLLAKAKIDEVLRSEENHPRALKLALAVDGRLDDLARRQRQRQQEDSQRLREQLAAEIASVKAELETTVTALDEKLAKREYDACIEEATSARAKIEGRPIDEQAEYIAIKEKILDIYHRAREGKERRDSQLAEVRRIEELIDAGSLASAGTAVDLLLAKPNLEPEIFDQATHLRERIKTLWNERRNVPDAFGAADHGKKKG